MKKVIIIIVAFSFGVLVGLLLPWNMCSECKGSLFSVCSHCFWDWCLRVLQVFGTLSAVVVALFKEWFYKKIYHPSFTIKTSSDTVQEVFDEKNIVTTYQSNLLITNTGSASATNCELYMSRLEYVSQNGSIKNTLVDVDSLQLWSSGEKRIDIPQTFSQTFEWFKVIRGVPKSAKVAAIPHQLIIGSKQIPTNMCNGSFNVVFKLVCQGSIPKEIKLTLSWNGQWHDHKSQMVTGLQYHEVP